MFDFGPEKVLVVLVFALVVFGPQRLPELARQIGSATRQLRGIQDTVHHEIRAALDPDQHPTSSSVAAPPATVTRASELPAPLSEGGTFE